MPAAREPRATGSRRRRPRRSHLLAVQDRGDRVLELVPRGIGVSLAPGDELVVDPAVIANLAVGVDHERLGRHLGAELAGKRSVPVAHDRKLQAEITRVGLDLGVAQVGVDADPEPLDRFGRERIDQGGERRAVTVRDRALRRIEDQRRRSVAGAARSTRRPSRPRTLVFLNPDAIGPQDRHAGETSNSNNEKPARRIPRAVEAMSSSRA